LLISALVTNIVGSLLAALLFLTLKLRHHQTYLGLWSLAWIAQTIVAALLLVQIPSDSIAVRQIALHGLVLTSVWLLACGIYESLNRKLNLAWLLGSAGFLALDAATGTTGWPTYAWVLLMQTNAAICLWRHGSVRGTGPGVVCLGLILWSIIPLNSPVYSLAPWLPGWGGLASAFFGLASALGLMALFFEARHLELQGGQAELEKTSATLKAILDTAPVNISLVKDRRVVWANPAAEKILGYSLEELTGFPTERLHPSREDWQRTGDELYGQITRTGKGSLEVTYVRKDGEQVICHVQGGPLSPEDLSQGYIFTVMDITDRKRAEKQLARQQERLEEMVAQRTAQLEKVNQELRHENAERKIAQEELTREKERFYSLIQHAPLSISLLGPDGYYKYLNPKFIETFGYDLSDIPRGRDWFHKAYPDAETRRQALTAWQDDLKTYGVGEARPRTYTVQCKDGSRKIVDFRPVAMANGDNLVFYVDVTEQKKIEAQLAHAEKMEAVGTLSGGVAHEFNNILMAMRGYLQLLSLDSGISDQAKDRIQKVEQAAERAANLIKKMLTFSRHEPKELTLVDVNTAVQTVQGMLQQSLDQPTQIKLDLAPELPGILANYSQLEQLLLNIALNARDAISGPGQITIRTSKQQLDDAFARIHFWAKPGSYLVISIIDTGSGMSPEIVGRAFDPFFTTKGPDKGTGLGLAIAYALVHNLGGGIQVETESGKGTTFTIYLPMPEVKQSDSLPQDNAE
jgi:PAS domain S-box-containing protein